MSSRTAGPKGKPKRYGKLLRSAYELADWNSIRRRRKSSIARTIFGEERTQTRSLTFSGIPFGRGDQRIVRGSSSSTSVQQSRTKQLRPSVTRFGAGTCHGAAIKASKICHGCSIRSSALQYYGRYYRSALYSVTRALDRDLAFWAKRKYKKLRHHLRRATRWIARISRRDPQLFAHWQMGVRRGSVMGAV